VAVNWIILLGGTAIGGGTLSGMAGCRQAYRRLGGIQSWRMLAEEAARAAVLAIDP
jgi:hypothetical protein